MKIKELKKIATYIILFVIVMILLLIPTIIHYKDNPQEITSQQTQLQEVRYYKHVPVKITKIQQTYFFKGMFKMYVEYKSDEYELTHSMTIGNNEPYANECYMGNYKVGDTIYAIMYTWQQGETINKRELGNLDYNR